jgi:hypothetical protein
MNSYNTVKMKKFLIFIFILPLFCQLDLSAQDTEIERLNSYKIAFFTRRLNLTSSEAERFWPIYNEYQNQKNQIQLEKLKLIKTFNQGEGTLSDNQISEIGDKLIGAIVTESELAVTLHKKLREVLPPAKVIRFYQAENQYKVQLLNELQNRQQNKPNQQNRLNRPPQQRLPVR